MKKLFISQPMKDKTDLEILAERERIIAKVKEYSEVNFDNEEIEVIESFMQNAPHEANPLWFLGKSLEYLSQADIVYFAKDWQKYRGCRIENICAKEYGIQHIISED